MPRRSEWVAVPRRSEWVAVPRRSEWAAVPGKWGRVAVLLARLSPANQEQAKRLMAGLRRSADALVAGGNETFERIGPGSAAGLWQRR